MRYCWLLNQASQTFYTFYYHPGVKFMAGYPTKAHTGHIRTHARPYCMYMDFSPTEFIYTALTNTPLRWVGLQGVPVPRASHCLESLVTVHNSLRDSRLAHTAVAAAMTDRSCSYQAHIACVTSPNRISILTCALRHILLRLINIWAQCLALN